MKGKDLSFSYLNKFKVYYSFKQGKKTYIFLHGIGGCKNHFVKAFDYIKNKNVGVLTIDLPGFGKSKLPKKFKIKSVISLHVEILNRLIKKLKIEKTILVVFSLATCYLPAIKNQKFWSKIEKVVVLEGSFVDADLTWSKKIYSLNKNTYDQYISDFKLKRKRIMKLLTFRDLNEKENNFFSNCFKNMDNSILKKLIFESVNMVKNKKLMNFLIKSKKKFILIYSKKLFLMRKNQYLKKRKVFLISKCNHYLMIDNENNTYKKVFL